MRVQAGAPVVERRGGKAHERRLEKLRAQDRAARAGRAPRSPRVPAPVLEWEASDAEMPLSSSAIAMGYARLGETELALAWLEKSFASHTRDLIYLKVDPS